MIIIRNCRMYNKSFFHGFFHSSDSPFSKLIGQHKKPGSTQSLIPPNWLAPLYYIIDLNPVNSATFYQTFDLPQ